MHAKTPEIYNNSSNLVWYVSYGSNLSRERFMHYINGGKYKHARSHLPGCTDKTPPRDIRPVTLNHPIYFGGESHTWGGGVAFIDTEAEGSTFARAYLISDKQFWQIVAQESASVAGLGEGLTPEDLPTDLSGIGGAGMYDRFIHLGDMDGYPMLSFTSPTRHAQPSAPTPEYLLTIGQGIAEAHGLSPERIARYLGSLEGTRELQSDVEQLLVTALALGPLVTPKPRLYEQCP